MMAAQTGPVCSEHWSLPSLLIIRSQLKSQLLRIFFHPPKVPARCSMARRIFRIRRLLHYLLIIYLTLCPYN